MLSITKLEFASPDIGLSHVVVDRGRRGGYSAIDGPDRDEDRQQRQRRKGPRFGIYARQAKAVRFGRLLSRSAVLARRLRQLSGDQERSGSPDASGRAIAIATDA